MLGPKSFMPEWAAVFSLGCILMLHIPWDSLCKCDTYRTLDRHHKRPAVSHTYSKLIFISKTLVLVLGCMAYWLVGYPLAFGGGGSSFLGNTYWASHGLDVDDYPFFFFHFVFAATAATIVSGAMAERCEFYAYIAYSTYITGTFNLVLVLWDHANVECIILNILTATFWFHKDSYILW